MRPDHVMLVSVTPLAAAGLYFLIAGDLSLAEGIAATGVVLLACIYAYATYRVAERTIHLQSATMFSLGRAAWSVLPDTVRVGRVLLDAVRERPGSAEDRVQHQSFWFGEDTAADAGRRGVSILALSLAPNGYMVDFEENGDALVHQLRPAPADADSDWPA